MKPIFAKIVRVAKYRSGDATIFGFATVADYRLYCLDGANKVASAEWIEADDDYAAIKVAKEMHDGRECEVWQGRRLIARLDLRRTG